MKEIGRTTCRMVKGLRPGETVLSMKGATKRGRSMETVMNNIYIYLQKKKFLYRNVRVSYIDSVIEL